MDKPIRRVQPRMPIPRNIEDWPPIDDKSRKYHLGRLKRWRRDWVSPRSVNVNHPRYPEGRQLADEAEAAIKGALNQREVMDAFARLYEFERSVTKPLDDPPPAPADDRGPTLH